MSIFRLRSPKPKPVFESAPNRSVRPTTTKQSDAASLSTKFCGDVRPTMFLHPAPRQSLGREIVWATMRRTVAYYDFGYAPEIW
jgi:hypothetical protein